MGLRDRTWRRFLNGPDPEVLADLYDPALREAVRLSDRTILMESGPGRVKSEFRVDLPRPRHADDMPVAELTGRLTHELKAEVARHVA